MNKKLLLFVAALGIVGIFGSRVSAYQFGGGTMDTDEERNRITLQVYNTDNVAHEDGDVLCWADGSHDGVDVSTTATANNGLVAGVALGDIAAHAWGTLLVRGYHDSITIGVRVDAGANLVTSTTAEAAGVYTIAQATGTAANQGAISGAFAVALETSESSTTVKGFLK